LAIGIRAEGIDQQTRLGIQRTQIGSITTEYVKIGQGAKIWVDEDGMLAFPKTSSFSIEHYVVDSDANQGLYASFTRAGANITRDSALVGRTVDSVTLRLDKVGSPDGTVYIRIRDAADNIIREMSIEAETITVAASDYTFMMQPYSFQSGDRLLVEYDQGNYENRVRVWFSSTDKFGQDETYFIDYSDSAYHSFMENDLAGIFSDIVEEVRFVADPPYGFSISEPSTKTVRYEKQYSSPLDVKLHLPEYHLERGKSTTHDLEISWDGVEKLTVSEITFDSNPKLFKIGKPSSLMASETGGRITVPVTVSIPISGFAAERNVGITVTIIDENKMFKTVTTTTRLVVEESQNPFLYTIVIIASIVLGVAFLKFRHILRGKL
jgi:hypothetical protein